MRPLKSRIPQVDVGELRRGMGLSVEEFAGRYGLTVSSVRNWEAGLSEPYKTARIVLAMVAQYPEVVHEVLGLAKADRSFRAFPDA